MTGDRPSPVTVVFFSRLRRLVEWFQAPGEGFRAPGARLAAGEELSERFRRYPLVMADIAIENGDL